MFSLSFYLALSLVSIVIYLKFDSGQEKRSVFRKLNTEKITYLTESSKILKNHKFIYFQTLNSKFLKLTKNWICQVSESVLNQTLFIATDLKSFEAIKNYTNHVILSQNSVSNEKLSYGEINYFKYMLWRTAVILDLLKNNIPLFIIESDATWLSNPSDYIEKNNYQGCDFIAGNDRITKVKVAECGFILLNSTENMLKLWQELYYKLETNWNLIKNSSFRSKSKIVRARQLGRLNEMNLFNALLKENKYQTISDCWFPVNDFPNGLWYSDRWPVNKTEISVPVVIQNNYIKGNEKKVERAKKFGHWFLDENDNCLKNK